jgi:hypothetical protein
MKGFLEGTSMSAHLFSFLADLLLFLILFSFIFLEILHLFILYIFLFHLFQDYSSWDPSFHIYYKSPQLMKKRKREERGKEGAQGLTVQPLVSCS